MNLMTTFRSAAILLLAAACSTVSQGQDAGNAGTQKTIEITAKRYSFSPEEITVVKGQTVTIVLNSTDVKHGLRIKELGFNVESKPGHPESAALTPSKTGEFDGSCSHFCGMGHGSMKLKVKVVDAPAQ